MWVFRQGVCNMCFHKAVSDMVENIRNDIKRIESWCNAIETMCEVEAKKKDRVKINEDDWNFIHDQRLWMHKSGYFITQPGANIFAVFDPHGFKEPYILYPGSLDDAKLYVQKITGDLSNE